MIAVHHWDATARNCRPCGIDDLPTTIAEVHPDDVWWVDLEDPTHQEEERIFGTFFPVHPLTREDITRQRSAPDHGTHFPKVEEFPNYLFVIVNPLPPGLLDAIRKSTKGGTGNGPIPPTVAELMKRKHRPQLSAVMNRNVLVTHHYASLDCVFAARGYLNRHTEAFRRGPDFLFHHVLDAMVDEYAPIVERIADRLDVLESRMFRSPSPKLLSRLLRLKRVVTSLRKTLILEREVLARLIRGEFDLVDDREVAYYRNVYDHLVRYTELIESAREMVSDLMETHLTAVSTRLNQVMKVLTMISTVVLPMTLVAGIYGMNFEHMPELKWEYGYYLTLGVMASLGVGSLVFFRWRGWL
jgi:magnesium transporter